MNWYWYYNYIKIKIGVKKIFFRKIENFVFFGKKFYLYFDVFIFYNVKNIYVFLLFFNKIKFKNFSFIYIL